MSYLFNRTNLAIIIVLSFIFILVINQLTIFIQSAKISNIQAYFTSQFQTDIFKTQESCQNTTEFLCEYRLCDRVPSGLTYEEACGDNFKEGWRSTNIPIPEFFQFVENIKLTIKGMSSVGTLEILPIVETITYSSTKLSGNPVNPKKIRQNDITRLLNKVILFDLATMTVKTINNPANEPVYTLYIASKKSPNRPVAQADTSLKELTFACAESECSRELTDIIRLIIRLWDGNIIESSLN